MSVLVKSLKSRFTGCLLGLALGDSLGAPFEGMPGGEYSYSREGPFIYTDDTEMMINLTESILSSRGVDPEHIAQTFVRGLNPRRGYGPGTLMVLALIERDMPFNEASRAVFPDGSCGNGAAMRVSPVGLLYWWNSKLLLEAATESSLPTHVHPLGIEGAKVMAHAVGLTIQGMAKEDIPGFLLEQVEEDTFRKKLSSIIHLLGKYADSQEIIHLLGNGVLAQDSVPTALYAFIKFGKDYGKMIEFCLSLGGDTDTIAAMAGALSGAYVSEDNLPIECLQRLEEVDRIRDLAMRLFELSGTLKSEYNNKKG